MRKSPNYKEGDLIRIDRCGDMTLCFVSARSEPLKIREIPVRELEVYSSMPDLFLDIEGKLGLIVYVIRNKLEQVTAYRVLINGHEVFCKVTIADRYFKLVETKGDESR